MPIYLNRITKTTTSCVAIVLALVVVSPVFADTTTPVTSMTKNPANPNGNNNWYKNPVQITLNGTDLESGIKEINYKIGEQDWKKETFYQTLNLVVNPSFENPNLESWEPESENGSGSVTQDFSTSLPSFGVSSVKVVSTDLGWYGVTNKNNFAAAEPYITMIASAWLKTENVENAYFKIYSASLDSNNNIVKTYIGASNKISGNNNWTKLWHTFTISSPNTIGIIIEIGMDGTGTLWADAVNISKTSNQPTASFYISEDGTHTIQYYSVDHAGNTETTKNTEVKIDQTPPNNWSNTTINHNISDPEYMLSIQTNVQDQISGISNLTKEFQYKTETQFGTHQNIQDCNTQWNEGNWETLDTYPSNSGNFSTQLKTPKINFCDNMWNKCKSVKFKAYDVAGNESTKDYCINGPWIKTSNGGKVKSNKSINMISSATGNNSDGIIEVTNTSLEYFTTTNNYISKGINSNNNQSNNIYENIWQKTKNHVESNELISNDGIYYTTGNLEINNVPNEVTSNTFNQIFFINGNLTINTDLEISNTSTLLFIVKGNVNIAKDVQNISSAIITNQNLYTAYNINTNETTLPLELKGFYTADKFYLQRNLQINSQPTEHFIYEPKYLIKMKEYINESQIEWNN